MCIYFSTSPYLGLDWCFSAAHKCCSGISNKIQIITTLQEYAIEEYLPGEGYICEDVSLGMHHNRHSKFPLTIYAHGFIGYLMS